MGVRLIFSLIFFAFSTTAWATSQRQCIAENLNSILLGPTDEELRVLVQHEGNFFKLKPRSPDETAKLNNDVIESLNKIPIAKASERSKRKGTFSKKEIDDLYNDIAADKHVKETLCDPDQRSKVYTNAHEGFCFARAMAVHVKALQSGAINGNVLKIWNVGELTSGKDDWKFHVATLVREDGGKWFAIDPKMPRAMPVEEWYARMKTLYDRKGINRVFVTPASRFSANTDEKYLRRRLTSSFYDGFFMDILDSIYRENTGGRPSPWVKIKSQQKREQFIQEVRSWLGLGAASTPFIGMGYYLHSREPSPSPSPMNRQK